MDPQRSHIILDSGVTGSGLVFYFSCLELELRGFDLITGRPNGVASSDNKSHQGGLR